MVLPNADALFRFEIKFLSRFHCVGLIPGIDVTDGLGAFTIGCVLIGRDLGMQSRVADLLAPRLGEGEKEPLVASESVNDRQLFAVERWLVSGIGGRQTGNIGAIFAQRWLTVHMQ